MAKKEKRAENTINLLEAPISEDVKSRAKAYFDIYKTSERINTVWDEVIYPEKSATLLRTSIDAEIAKLKETRAKTKAEELVLMNLGERVDALKSRMDFWTAPEFNYNSYLKAIGIAKEDVENVAGYYAGKNLQEYAESALDEIGGQFTEKPTSKEKLREIEEYYRRLLRVSFDLAPQKVKAFIPDFKAYMETVSFSESETDPRSFHRTGRIVINLYSQPLIVVRRNNRLENIIDLLSMADIVGEEGLLGHQGQFIMTERSGIPSMMKLQDASTVTNAEAIAELGKSRLAKHVIENPDLIERKNSDDDFTLLRKRRSKLKESGGFLTTFMNAYRDYFYFNNGRNVSETAETLAKVLRDPTYASGYTKERIARVMQTEFFKDSRNRVEKWAYVVSDMLVKRFEKRLGTMNAESKEVVFDQLQIGYWPRKSFEAYFEYLIQDAN